MLKQFYIIVKIFTHENNFYSSMHMSLCMKFYFRYCIRDNARLNNVH